MEEKREVTSKDLKINTIKQIEEHDWSSFVSAVYGRPYDFQQQYGCQDRGVKNFTVPVEDPDDFENTEIPSNSNGEEGVSFKAWLEADPEDDNGFFWTRNFYPEFDMVCNDLYEKGLLEAGSYQIRIDW